MATAKDLLHKLQASISDNKYNEVSGYARRIKDYEGVNAEAIDAVLNATSDIMLDINAERDAETFERERANELSRLDRIALRQRLSAYQQRETNSRNKLSDELQSVFGPRGKKRTRKGKAGALRKSWKHCKILV